MYMNEVKSDQTKYTRQMQLATNIYLLIMVCVFPLFTGLRGYIQVQDKRFIFFASCTLIWIICLAVIILNNRKYVYFSLTLHEKIVTFLSFTVIISTLLSPSKFGSCLIGLNCNGLLTRLLYCCIILGVSRYSRPGAIHFYAFVAAYFICCIIALFQLIGFNALNLYPGVMNYYSPYVVEMGRFLGTMGNVDTMSAYHCIALPIILFFVILNNTKKRFLLLVPLCLGLVCMMWAGVSSGILAFAFVIGLCPIILILRRVVHTNAIMPRRKLILTAGIILAIYIAALLCIYFSPAESGTIYELSSILHGTIADEFGSGRIRIWRDCISLIKQYPLFGLGPDMLHEFSGVVFTRYSEVLGETIRTLNDDAHNMYLQSLLDFGVIGSLPYFSLLILVFVRLVRSYYDVWALVLAGGFVSFCFQAFFNISSCMIDPLFFILVGIVLQRSETNREVKNVRT